MSRRLIVFTRAPRVGHVKTRLIPVLGPEATAQLHENLVRHCLQSTMQPDAWQTELHCSPTTNHPFLNSLAQTYNLQTYTQSGGDLGERMAAGMTSALTRGRHSVLVGTDCPDLVTEDIHAAFDTLEAGSDAVIGPAEDGGYYLIGLSRAAHRIFEDVPWGSHEVLEVTRARFEQLGWSWSELAIRWDVDRPDDLARLRGDPRLRHLLPDNRIRINS